MLGSLASRLLSLFGVVVVVCSNGMDVEEHHANYTCCNPLQIHLKEHCKHTLTYNGEAAQKDLPDCREGLGPLLSDAFSRTISQTIAYIDGAKIECTLPCQKDGDKLEIRICIDFTVAIVCENGKFTVDENFDYKAQSCPQFQLNQTPLQPQGHVGLLLVALLITGFFSIC